MGKPGGIPAGASDVNESDPRGASPAPSALTAADRPYKSGMTLSQALAIMRRMCDNGHIDPDLFDVFVQQGVHLRYAQEFLDPAQCDL